MNSHSLSCLSNKSVHYHNNGALSGELTRIILCVVPGDFWSNDSRIRRKGREEKRVLQVPTTMLKATNEQQDDGAGILHQVAQFPIDQVYFIFTRHPCPSPPTQDPLRQGTGC